MKNRKTRSTKEGSVDVTKAAGPRRPLRKPPGKQPQSSSPAKPAQPSPPPKKTAGK